jgi:putative transcriptional regulator
MLLQPGTFIKATPALATTFFENSLIYITEYNSAGALGFIINQSFGRTLNELEEFKNCQPLPLFTGGPVDQEHLFMLHNRPDLLDYSLAIANGIYMGGALKQAIDAFNNNTLTLQNCKLFIGYCGWDAEELEAEIEEGSWTIEDLPDVILLNAQ